MRPMRALGCLIVFLSVVSFGAATLQQRYVGRSGCDTEFKSSLNDYGIRLDSRQRTRLEAHAFKSKAVLAIVQYSSDSDQCGIVRDAVQSRRPGSSFVWQCVDKRFPHAVVVGTWPAEHSGVSGPASEAWRIDLKDLRFVHLNGPVICKAGNYAGADHGEDLATWARARSEQ